MEKILLLVLGICMVVLSNINLKGNANTIHWYNRTKVSKENVKNYAKTMGVGTLTIGISFILTATLQMIYDIENLYYISLAGIIIGIVIMTFAQLKYNKGIF
mgnify:CR=1 FL=1